MNITSVLRDLSKELGKIQPFLDVSPVSGHLILGGEVTSYSVTVTQGSGSPPWEASFALFQGGREVRLYRDGGVVPGILAAAPAEMAAAVATHMGFVALPVKK